MGVWGCMLNSRCSDTPRWRYGPGRWCVRVRFPQGNRESYSGGGGDGRGMTSCTVVYVAKAATGEAQGFQKGVKRRVRNGCYKWCLVVCTQLPVFSYGECPERWKTLLSVSIFEMKLTWFITYKADLEHRKLIWSRADPEFLEFKYRMAIKLFRRTNHHHV